jgi:hypothetical protein
LSKTAGPTRVVMPDGRRVQSPLTTEFLREVF